MCSVGSVLEERYEIISLLGEGGFSTAWQAVDRSADRTVALKVLNPGILKRHRGSRARFRREVGILSSLTQENVARVFGFSETPESCFLVQEILEGESLQDWVQPRRDSPDEHLSLLRVIRGIAAGLAFVHSHRILHRDLKPSNIRIVRDVSSEEGEGEQGPGTDTVRILDFGLSRLIDFSRADEHPEIAHSFSYMAPEQSGLLRQQVDQRSDLYSLGILCYELLCGALPYSAGNARVLLQHHLTRTPVPLAERNPNLPAGLVQIVERLMAKSPAERYPSCGVLLADLDAFQEAWKQGTTSFPLPGVTGRTRAALNPRVELIERSNQLDDLLKSFRHAKQGRGSILFVTGETGLGKTRLMEEFRASAGPREGLFLYGKCDEFRSHVPYQPIAFVLEDFAGRFRGWSERRKKSFRKDMVERLGEGAGAMLSLTPEMKELLGNPPSPPSLEPAREVERLMEASGNFFCGLAEKEKPLVLVFDDLQWGREESFRVLMQIAEHIPEVPIVLVGVYRQEGLTDNPFLRRFADRMQRMPGAVRMLALRSLSPEGIRAMVRATAGRTERGFRLLCDEVGRISRGNPFFVNETLHAFVERRILERSPTGDAWSYDPENPGREEIPYNLLDLVLKRFERLTPDAQSVLSVAAVIGRQFDFAFLVEATGMGEDRLLDCLDEMVGLQLVDETLRGEHDDYCFLHDKIRQAAYERIPEEERAGIHERVGLALETAELEEGTETDVFALAYHFCNGQDKEKALRYSLTAGEMASKQSANREALQHFWEAARRIDESQRGEFFHVRERIGDLHDLLGEFEPAMTTFEELKALASSGLSRARLERKVGTVLMKKGDFNGSVKRLDRAMELLEKKPRNSKLLNFLGTYFHFFLQVFFGDFFYISQGGERDDVRERNRELCRIYKERFLFFVYVENVKGLENHLMHVRYAKKSGDDTLRAGSYLFRSFRV